MKTDSKFTLKMIHTCTHGALESLTNIYGFKLLLLLFTFSFLATARGLWDLNSLTSDRTRAHGNESMKF